MNGSSSIERTYYTDENEKVNKERERGNELIERYQDIYLSVHSM